MRRYILAHPLAFALAVGLAAIVQASAPLLTLVSMFVIDTVHTGDSRDLLGLIPIVVAIFIFFALSVVFNGYAMVNYTTKMTFTLRKDLFTAIMDTKISDFSQDNSAKYISVMNNDINTITQKYFSSIVEIVKFIITIVVAGIIMVTIHPILALVIGGISLSPMLGPMIFSKRLVTTQFLVSTQTMVLNQKIKDYLSGFEVIKTFGVEKNIIPKFLTAADNARKASQKAGVAGFNMAAVTMSTLVAVSLTTYIIAGIFAARGSITLGAVVAVAGLSGYIQHPIHMISNLWGSIKSTQGINQQVLDMIGQKDSTTRPVKVGKLAGDVVLSNVNFSYTPTAPALKNIHYTFKKGGKYAIVGHSGSGKSTLTKLLLGYYDNYSGDAILNGANIRDIDRESLYNVVSALPQNVFLLDDTLKNNITLYNDFTQDQYHRALSKANLLPVIDALPKGADTLLGEGGNTISFGERQRVAIARALLKGSDILILDEATSNLDNVVAQSIEKSIVDMEGLTCIFVTHRYSKDILTQCDGIIVMKDGEIFEHGTFDSLCHARGYFYSLYHGSVLEP